MLPLLLLLFLNWWCSVPLISHNSLACLNAYPNSAPELCYELNPIKRNVIIAFMCLHYYHTYVYILCIYEITLHFWSNIITAPKYSISYFMGCLSHSPTHTHINSVDFGSDFVVVVSCLIQKKLSQIKIILITFFIQHSFFWFVISFLSVSVFVIPQYKVWQFAIEK